MGKGVTVAAGVTDGLGVSVAAGSVVGCGVHVAGNTNCGVGVAVGNSSSGGKVAGGKGLILDCGLTKITRKNPPMHKVAINTATVSTFRIIAQILLRELVGSL